MLLLITFSWLTNYLKENQLVWRATSYRPFQGLWCKMQSCQSQDTCSQQEGYLPTARSLDVVSGNKMIFPSEICLPQWLTLLRLTANLWYRCGAEKHRRRVLKKWILMSSWYCDFKVNFLCRKSIYFLGDLSKMHCFKKIYKIWTIFKVFIEFVMILSLIYVLFFGCEACGIFTPWPGIDQRSNLHPGIRRWILKHWRAREGPNALIFKSGFSFCDSELPS